MDDIKETIATINQMKADGIIGQYAIGGAVGATFYLEPAATEDVDVFIPIEATVEQPIITLEPIYNYLRAKGCREKGEYIVIAGWPVQFLPPDGSLVEEAIRDAVDKSLDGIPVRVFTPEHLAAIALKVGRPKDKIRLLQFLEAHAIDESLFDSILKRHGLSERWVNSKDSRPRSHGIQSPT